MGDSDGMFGRELVDGGVAYVDWVDVAVVVAVHVAIG